MKIHEFQLELQLKIPGRQTLGCKNPGIQDNYMLNTKEDERTAGRRKVGRKTPSCKTMNPKRKTEAVKP